MNRVIFLGTGTSQGVPMIGCGCEVCQSDDPRDKRLRSSIYVEYEELKLVVDAGPDFRAQMLRAGIKDLDAILITHNHIDHVGGLDDVRALNYFEQRAFPIYCEEITYESLKRTFYYAFSKYKYPGAPEYVIRLIDDKPFKINGVEIIPIRAMHYKLPILGFRFGDFAYITDANYIPDEEFEKLKGVKYFVVNTVKRTKHISHYSLPEAIAVAQRVGARQSFLTHLSHQLPKYEEFAKELPEGIQSAYDGLEIIY